MDALVSGYLAKQARDDNSVGLQEISEALLRHEGVSGNKTPFRITSPAMRRWRTLHGLPLREPPEGSNFLHMENPADVLPAVVRQLRNYSERPAQYGLGAKPTVREALSKFDQTGGEQFDGLLQMINGLYRNRPVITMPLDYFTGGNRLHVPSESN